MPGINGRSFSGMIYRFNALGHPIKGIGRLGAVVRGLLVILGMVLIGRNQAQTGKLSMQPVTDHGMISGVSEMNEWIQMDGNVERIKLGNK